MDYCLSHLGIPSLGSLPSDSTGKARLRARIAGGGWGNLRVVSSAGAKEREFSSLNTPLEPRSVTGKYLSSVLQNQKDFFHAAVAEELKRLADDRAGAVSRMVLSSDSDEACLHRRIAQMKEDDCRSSVEDVMYMLIIFKFSEIRVPLVPRLCRCIYNSRLEIWPSKDWELESVHSFEALEMIREHIASVVGLRANSSITEHWATTQIQRQQLGRVYAASILFGYFLQSASLRLHLEQSLASASQDLCLSHSTSLKFPEMLQYSLKNILFGDIRNMKSASIDQDLIRGERRREKLRCYVMGFDPETLQRCSKVKSKECANLIEKHSCALFGDEKNGMETDEVILTSFSTLKRLVLEAVAFGSFLWDIEEYVDTIYTLKRE